jgi:hypothetical protein
MPEAGGHEEAEALAGESRALSRYATIWAWVVVLCTIALRTALVGALFICAFPPLVPRDCPTDTDVLLDASWRIAVNHARSAGLNYGETIVFTYGPLGFVSCPMDVGNNLAVSALFRVLVYFVSVSSLCLYAWRCRNTTTFATILVVACLAGCWQEIEKSVIVGTIGCLGLAWVWRSRAFAGIAGALCAFSLLLKFSSGVACLASMLVWAACAMAFRPRDEWARLTMIVGVTFLTSLIGLFWIFGGPITGILPWLRYSWSVSSGYSQMTTPGPLWELGLAICEIVIVTWAAFCARADRRCCFAFILVAPAIFLNFKHGFMRQDAYHAPFFFISVPLLACFPLIDARRLRGRIALAAACIVLLMMSSVHRLWYLGTSVSMRDSAYWSLRAAEASEKIESIADVMRQAAWTQQATSQLLPMGWSNLVECKEWESRRRAMNTNWCRQSAKHKLPAGILAQIGDGSIDAYPWDVYLPIMNNLRWCPRPILQSYSAYTPTLDRLGASQYASERGPDFILYRHQAIDHQHPMLVDVLTWLEMYRWYDVEEQIDSEYALLTRRSQPRFAEAVPAGSQRLSFGERWDIPQVDALDAVVLQADLKLTLAGHARETLFRIHPPWLRVEYQDGSAKMFRLVWRNAKSGFLVSDLPTYLDPVVRMWQGDRGAAVKAVAFHSDPLFVNQHDRSFEPTIEIRWAVIRHYYGK